MLLKLENFPGQEQRVIVYCINNRGEIFILRELELLVLLRPTSDSEGHFKFVGAAYAFSDLETPPWVASDSPSGAITLILAWIAGNGHKAVM